jgi:hypothetical protein
VCQERRLERLQHSHLPPIEERERAQSTWARTPPVATYCVQRSSLHRGDFSGILRKTRVLGNTRPPMSHVCGRRYREMDSRNKYGVITYGVRSSPTSTPDGFSWTSHNLRRGAASAAYAIGARLMDIRHVSGWSTISSVLDAKYVNFMMQSSPKARMFFGSLIKDPLPQVVAAPPRRLRRRA